MDFVLALHSHLPYVLNHGRWPHGSDWLSEAAIDTYLPLLEALNGLEIAGVPSPLTLGITPILANQLASPTFAGELEAFVAQRFEACDAAVAELTTEGERHLVPIAEYWRGRLHRLLRLFERVDGDLVRAFRRHEASERIEIMSSAATHAFLPLLARDESVRLQLALGRAEHQRLFGVAPRGCWLPECAYRPRGPWQPHPAAPSAADRAGIEAHLGRAGFRYFFTDAHLAQAGRTLGLYPEADFPGGPMLVAEEPLGLPAVRSPHRAYRIDPQPGTPAVAALVRDPRSSRQVWSRHQGYPGDGEYLEFHKIRFPGGLKLWRVTHPAVDLGGKQPYDPNAARARAREHARHYREVLHRIVAEERDDGDVVVAPFDTELFGHWWFEGVDFLTDVFRTLAEDRVIRPTTASTHLGRHPASATAELVPGSWGTNGDFSKWLNPETEWTWLRLWALEHQFWDTVSRGLAEPASHVLLAQAARELVLAQSSDWQFIISSATAADYASRRFLEHAENCARLLAAIDTDGPARVAAQDLAAALGRRNEVFPDILASVAVASRETAPLPA